MPKYYVVSGELETIVTAREPFEAAKKAISMAQGHVLDDFCIDERGFRGFCGDLKPQYIYNFNTVLKGLK